MINFIKIEVDTTLTGKAEILIAELAENDFYAFEENENILVGYIKEQDFNGEKLKSLLPESLPYKYSVIEDRNWNEEWESQLQPVIIDDFAGIRAAFHGKLRGVEHEIIITPKMSFGTGHHGTTFLMVEQMRKIDFRNKRVLDFGTGTGVLAILAQKLGAASVLAIDNDEWSINNALENFDANDCKHINLEKRNNIDGVSFVNIILANINFNVLVENSQTLSMLLQPGSLLIISGFLLKDEGGIGAVFVKNHFFIKDRNQKSGWAVLVLQKR